MYKDIHTHAYTKTTTRVSILNIFAHHDLISPMSSSFFDVYFQKDLTIVRVYIYIYLCIYIYMHSIKCTLCIDV